MERVSSDCWSPQSCNSSELTCRLHFPLAPNQILVVHEEREYRREVEQEVELRYELYCGPLVADCAAAHGDALSRGRDLLAPSGRSLRALIVLLAVLDEQVRLVRRLHWMVPAGLWFASALVARSRRLGRLAALGKLFLRLGRTVVDAVRLVLLQSGQLAADQLGGRARGRVLAVEEFGTGESGVVVARWPHLSLLARHSAPALGLTSGHLLAPRRRPSRLARVWSDESGARIERVDLLHFVARRTLLLPTRIFWLESAQILLLALDRSQRHFTRPLD